MVSWEGGGGEGGRGEQALNEKKEYFKLHLHGLEVGLR